MKSIDFERVAKAVREAEAGLSAEIATCVMAQSAEYREAAWAGSAWAMSMTTAALYGLDSMGLAWLPRSQAIFSIMAAGLIGFASGLWIRPFRRLLVGRRRLHDAAQRRAKEVFFDRGISRTKGRDGVLIYAGLFERRVVVLADVAVSARVDPKQWDKVVSAFLHGQKRGGVTEALCAAVETAAAILRAAGFSGAPSAGNELPDTPYTDEEK